MAQSSGTFWWLALGGAALAVSVGLGGLVLLRGRQAQAPAPPPVEAPKPAPAPAPPPTPACGEASLEVHALANAADPPVILWGVGGARLYVDDQAAFSPPEKPLRFTVGEHTLRIESPGAEPLHTRFLLEPFTPALIHAEKDEQLGLTLVRLGAVCASCEPPVSALDLRPARGPPATAPALLEAAAGHLRRDRWVQAVAALKLVQPRDRRSPAFLRLAAIAAASAGDLRQARALLRKIPAAQSNDLATLLPTHDRLTAEEQARRKDIHLARWNKLTEWFAAVAGRYQAEAPGPVTATSKRLEQLSAAFDTAVRRGGVDQQAAAVTAGEEALTVLLRSIRSQRPDDCRLQAELLALVAR